eukprot:GFUD01080257.1.p1 GENE.GFUD01080257.1~~GFUD01080257.1.p1  ORF type:complete len:560 (-),score=96.72 GFUD01080257.1:331-2010(-)
MTTMIDLSSPVSRGDISLLAPHVLAWVRDCVDLCTPNDVHIMDGSPQEDRELKTMLVKKGVLTPLPKYDNCFLARTDPRDVARTEGRTFLCSPKRKQSVPNPEGVKGQLGNWMDPAELGERIKTLFPGCMKGRTMYVIPFSMGPVGSKLSKIGLEITDSAYVAISMRVMTRVGTKVLTVLGEDPFVKCLHSVGVPLEEGTSDVQWPCNPDKVLVAHKPEAMEIFSFGSGYGGNSLLGKKCLALRLGSAMARKEGWLAEHMLISGIRTPDGTKKYITAAFPSACGKTNLAMMSPKLKGYEVTVVGDDIAWLRPDANGQLRAINPENGFFGVAPGTSMQSNPIAMATIFKDTIFSNVALTEDGGVWWEGMGDKPKSCIDWRGQPWKPNKCSTPAAHPNSRFCSPLVNCPSLDSAWEDPEGVPISSILFGGRRPRGVPLVYQSISWEHGVFMGACVKSEATAAAEHKGKAVMHDPFSMRPFFGYNFGDYLRHWLDMGKKTEKGTINLYGELVQTWRKWRIVVARIWRQHPSNSVDPGQVRWSCSCKWSSSWLGTNQRRTVLA